MIVEHEDTSRTWYEFDTRSERDKAARESRAPVKLFAAYEGPADTLVGAREARRK